MKLDPGMHIGMHLVCFTKTMCDSWRPRPAWRSSANLVSWPKCSGGSLVCGAVSVGVGGCCRWLPSFGALCGFGLFRSWPSLEALCWDASRFGLCLLGGNISSILRRSDDGGGGAVSFLRASLWKSWAFVSCGVVSSWRWKFGRSLRSLVFFLFIVVVVFSYFLFTSVRGFENECSRVIIGRIYPLVGIEAGFFW
jgi:hypothetical protein